MMLPLRSTHASDPATARQSALAALPRAESRPLRVSIVTPSLNQARFLRHAIDSVLAQGYPHFDYFVADGGSTDGSVDILRSYGDRLRWTSNPDGGQADAIARAFAHAEGDILGWLNADDVLLPGAVERVVDAFAERPAAGLIYGLGTILDEQGATVGPFKGCEKFDAWRLIHYSDFILQPAAFFRRSAYESVGGLDTRLCWSMDWDLWIKLSAHGEVHHLPVELAAARCWSGTKTHNGGWRRWRELGGISRRHAGRFWTPATWLYALDTLCHQLTPHLHGRGRRVAERAIQRAARAVGIRAGHYPDGWLGPQASVLVPRTWKRAMLRLDVVELPPPPRELRVELTLDGERFATLPTRSPGRLTELFRVPPGPSPFCRVGIHSDFWFRGPGDPRRLTLKLAGIEPVEAPGTVSGW